jgi:translation initiation factor IF-3
VPVPRRFDRRPPERDQTRINDRIRVPEVRLIGEDGNQIGVVNTSEALSYAQQRDLDLVEVAPEARPPVVRVLDYSKYKYEQAQKQKAARKHQQQITIREIKFRPKIAQNDYDTKKGHVTRFLLGKDKVKITIMFRGREVTHPERGTALLERLSGELSEIAVVEQMPVQDGRNMTMMLGPSKSVLAGEKDKNADGTENGATAAEASPAAVEAPTAAPAAAEEPTASPAAAEESEASPAAAEEPTAAPAAPAEPQPAAAAPEEPEPAAAPEKPKQPAAARKQPAAASSDA